jgi:farnesyl diphosphate synthase
VGKATFVSLMGLDQAKQEVKLLISEACDSLNEFGSKADGLRELADYVISRKK